MTDQVGVVISCDWMAFTVTAGKRRALLRRIGLPVMVLDRGFTGYTNSALVGEFGRVAWSPDRPHMGAHFVFSGRGVAELASAVGDLPRFVGELLMVWKARFTRFDVAFDDFAGSLDVAEIRRSLLGGLVVSHFQKARAFDNLARGVLAQGVEFGASSSAVRVRFYDKRGERLQKGVNPGDLPLQWVRCELQGRDERGHCLAEVFAGFQFDPAGARSRLLGVLRGVVRFVVPSGDGNRWRWPLAEWWSKFLEGAESARLCIEKVVHTIEKAAAWVKDAVGPTLAVLESAWGFERAWSFLYEVTQEGRERWGPKHRALVASASA